MPRIFDNQSLLLSDALNETFQTSQRADFCVGYFNLRGWRQIDQHIESWSGGEGNAVRVLIGMPTSPQDELYNALRLTADNGQRIDQSTAIRLKQEIARGFRDQLMHGAPKNADEEGLQRLSRQLRSGKVIVKLHTRFSLHAKLYLLYRNDVNNPITGFLGSSNLTFSGLAGNGELNVDVLDHDACEKLEKWFKDRWEDRFSVDITDELADIIDESWAREDLIPPYHIYLKMIYHLSEEALEGIKDFNIPKPFDEVLFDYQVEAVKIAARYLTKRGGVMIGDVVGLGKTLMACALAKINEIDTGHSTLIICPRNLQQMWNDYRNQYGLTADVLPLSLVEKHLAEVAARFRLVIIDESHNLRNRDGKRYRAIQEFIQQSGARCILLTATPYNKSFVDLGSQLRLFVDEQADLGIRPEKYLNEVGESGFIAKHQASPTSLAAFEQSPYADDWRELMRLFLVRRTRSFIIENYAESDPSAGRNYLPFGEDGRFYFPTRVPKTLKFEIDADDPDDTYARMFADDVINTINELHLPRYGLGNYIRPNVRPNSAEQEIIDGLARAGRRLKGFTRTNLFKRLESSGPAFIQSLERHILRNYVFLYALKNDLPLPIGTQGSELLDPAVDDEDSDFEVPRLYGEDREDVEEEDGVHADITQAIGDETQIRARAAQIYQQYERQYTKRFKWLPAKFTTKDLHRELLEDSHRLLSVLADCGKWDPYADAKLNVLEELLTVQHRNDKVLIFSQFADTVRYVVDELKLRGIDAVAAVTGDSASPTALANRFSPISNNKAKSIRPRDELRILVSTDVLSEGQNLQDCSIVVNYDLPWAIIRLIQRAGRVDRIGQRAEDVRCYSFLPAEGIEQIIKLRSRIRQRLDENAEVIGTDEAFFEDSDGRRKLHDLYSEKPGIFDDEPDEDDSDLASQALTVWQRAIRNEPRLENLIPEMPDVVYSTRSAQPYGLTHEGVVLYMKTAHGTDVLALVGWDGTVITQSQSRILEIAACGPESQAIERHSNHHEVVEAGVKALIKEVSQSGGQLGRPSSARFRTYELLKGFSNAAQTPRFIEPQDLKLTLEDIYKYPLQNAARDTLNRQLRSGASDEQIAEVAVRLRNENRLSVIQTDEQSSEPRIICSLGIRAPEGGVTHARRPGTH